MAGITVLLEAKNIHINILQFGGESVIHHGYIVIFIEFNFMAGFIFEDIWNIEHTK